MRTLNRPMFNMGGPIKQGIMHGIREPKRDGGKMLLVGQHPKEFQDKSGREKHVAPVVWGVGTGLARLLPWAARGAKAAWRFMKPTAKFRHPSVTQHPGASFKYSPAPYSAKEIAMNPKLWGQAIKENPGWALTGGLSAYNAPSTYETVKSVGKNVALQAADLAVPDWIWDQDKYLADKAAKEVVSGVPLNPNLQKLIAAVEKPKVPKKLSEAERKAFATKQRNERVDKYMEMMGYDRSKKMAIADALIDASKIVGDRGSLDPKNITQELINPIIQATSKRLDKPQQIREAVGLMATKAEIEKDLSAETDALDKEYKRTQIAVGKKSLERGFEKDMGDFFLGSRTKPDKKQTETYARIKADEYGLDFTKVTDEKIAAAPEGATESQIIQSVVGDDGIYMVGNALIKVTGGVPKVLIGA